MRKGRDIATESLGDVIELVRVRRQNGLLSVERFVGGRLEEGEIQFQDGRPVYARTGAKWGDEAVTELKNWRQAYFSFTSNAERPSSNAFAARNTPDTGYPVFPRLPTTQPVFPQQSYDNVPQLDSGDMQALPAGPSGTTGLELVVPQKLGGDRDVLSLPLTRPQRLVYMLVDGKRNFADLSRCTRKNIAELERLLGELRDRGLVAF